MEECKWNEPYSVTRPDWPHPINFVRKLKEVEKELPKGTIEITENGTGIDIAQYATADINVEGGVTPSGTIQITENNTYDVTNYASAEVNIPPQYVQGMERAQVQVFNHVMSYNTLSVYTSIKNDLSINLYSYDSDWLEYAQGIQTGKGRTVETAIGCPLILKPWRPNLDVENIHAEIEGTPTGCVYYDNILLDSEKNITGVIVIPTSSTASIGIKIIQDTVL